MSTPTPAPGDDPAEMDPSKWKQRMLALSYWFVKNLAVLALAAAVALLARVGSQTHESVDKLTSHTEKATQAVEKFHETVKPRVVYGPPKE